MPSESKMTEDIDELLDPGGLSDIWEKWGLHLFQDDAFIFALTWFMACMGYMDWLMQPLRMLVSPFLLLLWYVYVFAFS